MIRDAAAVGRVMNEHDEPQQSLPPALSKLAEAHGVATEYWDFHGQRRQVAQATIVAVLAELGVVADDAAAIETALAEVELAPWRAVVPPTVVVRAGDSARIAVHVVNGEPVRLDLELEAAAGGAIRTLTQVDEWHDPKEVDGVLVGRATFEIPPDLPLGYHDLRVSSPSRQATGQLIVVPERLQWPIALERHRAWGFAAQLYSVRSRRSWGVGDLADLADLAILSARELGADLLVINPLHAVEPEAPLTPSPYLPTTRRFTNPLYLRIEDIPEVAYLPATDRALIEWEAEEVQQLAAGQTYLDRDTAWRAKQAALAVVRQVPLTPARQAEFDAYVAEQGAGLRDFALWSAIAAHCTRTGEPWPEDAYSPDAPGALRLERELADDVAYHCWLQWLCDEQLARAQRAARDAGMSIGICHDLAVGVHPAGSDAWALADVLAPGISVGAPPDAYNQLGQDWSQPPWRPDALAQAGYRPYRDMLRTVMRHAGAIRVDHILGLFRLWWIPRGAGAQAGTYVRYDHEALIGILCLEAHRAGVVVIGEDLGVFEPWIRSYLEQRGILGTSVLWFEKDGSGEPLDPRLWRSATLATVTTHDLPPTASYLAGEHIDLRESLGLLTRPVAEERAAARRERDAVISQLESLRLLPPDASEREIIEALHRFLTWTPAMLTAVSLADAVGERRMQNQPGTDTQYPNWQIPLADGAGNAVLLDDLLDNPRLRSLVRAFTGGTPPQRQPK